MQHLPERSADLKRCLKGLFQMLVRALSKEPLSCLISGTSPEGCIDEAAEAPRHAQFCNEFDTVPFMYASVRAVVETLEVNE